MNVLFYIEPLTERENPLWKKGWVERVERVAGAMRSRWPALGCCCIVGEGLETVARAGLPGCRVEVIEHAELVPRFGNSALAVAGGWCRGGSETTLREMGAIVRSRTAGFSPDACVTLSPAPFLRTAFPRAPALHFEYGMFSRLPFPETGYLDPLGMFNAGVLGRYRQRITGYDPSDEERSVVETVRATYLPLIARENPLAPIVRERLGAFQRALLVVLQFSNFYGYDLHAFFPDQYDLLLQTLEGVPRSVAVVAVEHPLFPVLTEEVCAHLMKRHPNLVWLPECRSLSSASQYLMEFIDGVVTVSSSVGLQSLLWRKPLAVIGHSHLDLVADAHDLKGMVNALGRPWPEYKENVLAWLLTRHTVPFPLLLDGQVQCDLVERAVRCTIEGDESYEGYYAAPYADVGRIVKAYADDGELARLRRELAHREALVQDLTGVAAASEARSSALAGSLEESKQRVEAAERQVGELQRQQGKLETEVVELQRIASDSQRAADMMRDSLSWRLTKSLRFFWDRLPRR